MNTYKERKSLVESIIDSLLLELISELPNSSSKYEQITINPMRWRIDLEFEGLKTVSFTFNYNEILEKNNSVFPKIDRVLSINRGNMPI
ncbi:hypothetical protein GCM10008022_03800 [Paenibacillus hunanensis]|nr:hypothetical protein GCM10008022_03800 [Paenibacillus hunanensis]